MPVLAKRKFRQPQSLIETVIVEWERLREPLAELAEGTGIELSSVRLRAPVPRPGAIVCLAGNYLEYGRRSVSGFDAFLKSPASVIGDGETVQLPAEEASV